MMIWCKKIMGGKDYEVYEKKLICSVFGHKCNSFDKFICNAGRCLLRKIQELKQALSREAYRDITSAQGRM